MRSIYAFRSLICIIDIGNIHNGTCRIIIFPRYMRAYKAGAIISDVATHFEPCHGLIRPYIFLFNSLMPIMELWESGVFRSLFALLCGFGLKNDITIENDTVWIHKYSRNTSR